MIGVEFLLLQSTRRRTAMHKVLTTADGDFIQVSDALDTSREMTGYLTCSCGNQIPGLLAAEKIDQTPDGPVTFARHILFCQRCGVRVPLQSTVRTYAELIAELGRLLELPLDEVYLTTEPVILTE